MKWFILLSLFVSGSLGAKLLGSEKCTWGPSYWCSGLAQSAGCRVIVCYFNTCILQWKLLNVITNNVIINRCILVEKVVNTGLNVLWRLLNGITENDINRLIESDLSRFTSPKLLYHT